jgi:signal transduction histidine kinase
MGESMERDAGPGGQAAFLAGGGEMGALLRAHDWARTPLGPPILWPQSLKTAIRIMLTSRQPIWIGWGAALTFFYNDPYRAIVGGKHPRALGQPIADVWGEIYESIGPMLQTAMGGIEGIYVEEQLLIMERNGYSEETYYTFSFSPIPDDLGHPGGIICANTEDTKRVMGERQLTLLRDLGARTSEARTRQAVGRAAAAALAGNDRDLPFAAIYLPEPGGGLTLAGATGIEAGHPAAPHAIAADAVLPWPTAEVLRSRGARQVQDLAILFGQALPFGAWQRAPPRAAWLQALPTGDPERSGLLIVGLNPFRLFDRGYEDFLGLVAGQLTGAIANADAYEQERRRAETLAELDRAKTTFFSNVSHEFRTPLTLMLGPLEDSLAEPEHLRQADLERLRLVHRNGLRLLRLVNSLLDFSRIEAGRSDARFEPADLGAFTAEIASSFRSTTEKAGLALRIDCAPGKPVHVDRGMWEKIVLNLISNAFKFTFDGAIDIRMSQRDGHAALEVRDTGTGIPAAQLSRIFDRFHRVEGARGRTFEGSGIGLALVKELVEIHGGRIAVDSTEGSGTLFTVSLPLGSRHLPPDQVRAAPSTAAAPAAARAFVEEALSWLPQATALRDAMADGLPTEATSQERAHILLADDNADMRDYVARLLGVQHRCEVVGDGVTALATLHQRRPDLLITDVMMPNLDGFGLLAAIRADAALRDIPVIMLSARAGEEARVEGLDAGADDYLIKPFSARELIARVDGALALARVRRQLTLSLQDKVTERTAELEAANGRLLAEAEERTRIEQVLRQAQKMEAIGKLTGGVAHDFNNLLQVVGGNLQLLQEDVAGDDRAEQRVRAAMAGVTRGAKLASQLLAFGRRQPLAPKVVNLGRFVRGMDDLLRRALGEGIEIETVISGGLWNSLVDPSHVENALLNLALNARDAMDGRGKLTIEAGNASLTDDYAVRHTDVTPGQYVMLAVTDTGCGMAPEIVEQVFEPFFTTKPEGQGTGLGLSMVYGFVKQSRGHIKIYSEPGQGTTMRIYLPRAQQAEDLASEVDAGPVTGGSETVLVVEDDEDVRGIVIEMLSGLGYRVLRARDATSALAIVESGVPIDLLFTDVVMPGPLRSPELARQARQRLPGIAVLFTSGYTDNAIVHGGQLDRGVELLSKPYTRDALARRLRQVLRGQDRPEAAPPAAAAPRRAPADGAMTILFVEDQALIRMASAAMLTRLGHQVRQAGDAEQALDMLDAGVEVLMTDLGLPGMSGAALAVEALRRFPALRVVYASGLDAVPPGEGAPPGVMLRKPYDMRSLTRALAAVRTP